MVSPEYPQVWCPRNTPGIPVPGIPGIPSIPKEECLDRLILSSEDQLRYVLSEYLQYYHHERIHQGLHRIIEPPPEGREGDIIGIERLGGLLKSYHRQAA